MYKRQRKNILIPLRQLFQNLKTLEPYEKQQYIEKFKTDNAELFNKFSKMHQHLQARSQQSTPQKSTDLEMILETLFGATPVHQPIQDSIDFSFSSDKTSLSASLQEYIQARISH